MFLIILSSGVSLCFEITCILWFFLKSDYLIRVWFYGNFNFFSESFELITVCSEIAQTSEIFWIENSVKFLKSKWLFVMIAFWKSWLHNILFSKFPCYCFYMGDLVFLPFAYFALIWIWINFFTRVCVHLSNSVIIELFTFRVRRRVTLFNL
jgi:hypothetical protein